MKNRWRGKVDVDENAATMLPGVALKYFDAGAALFASEHSAEELHEFRLKTKHFRYLLELFEERYGTRLSTLMKRLRPVQDALGEINDAATALAWLKEDESQRVKDFLEERISTKSAKFEQYWKSVFDKEGERERWVQVLSRGKASSHAETVEDPKTGIGKTVK